MAAAKGSQGKKRQTKDGGTGPRKGAGGNGGNGSGGNGGNGSGGNGGKKGFFGKLALDILVRVVANAVSDGLGEILGNEDFDIQPQDEPDDDDII